MHDTRSQYARPAVRHIHYVDTLNVSFQLDKGNREDFRKLCILRNRLAPHCSKTLISIGEQSYSELRSKMSANNEYHSLPLQRPTAMALQLILDSGLTATITRCDIACDLIAEDWEHAFYLHRQVDSHLVMVGARGFSRYVQSPTDPRDVLRYDGARQGKPGVTLIQYVPIDPRRRKHGFPCAHVELKVNGSVALNRLGLREVDDLAQLNLGLWWQELFTEVWDRWHLFRRRRVLAVREHYSDGAPCPPSSRSPISGGWTAQDTRRSAPAYDMIDPLRDPFARLAPARCRRRAYSHVFHPRRRGPLTSVC